MSRWTDALESVMHGDIPYAGFQDRDPKVLHSQSGCSLEINYWWYRTDCQHYVCEMKCAHDSWTGSPESELLFAKLCPNEDTEENREEQRRWVTESVGRLKSVMLELESLGYEFTGFNSFQRQFDRNSLVRYSSNLEWHCYGNGQFQDKFVRYAEMRIGGSFKLAEHCPLDESRPHSLHCDSLVDGVLKCERMYATLESLAFMSSELKDRVLES